MKKLSMELGNLKTVKPICLALKVLPTLMKGQVQSREENFEDRTYPRGGGFDMIALCEEAANGPYPARSVEVH